MRLNPLFVTLEKMQLGGGGGGKPHSAFFQLDEKRAAGANYHAEAS